MPSCNLPVSTTQPILMPSPAPPSQILRATMLEIPMGMGMKKSVPARPVVQVKHPATLRPGSYPIVPANADLAFLERTKLNLNPEYTGSGIGILILILVREGAIALFPASC